MAQLDTQQVGITGSDIAGAAVAAEAGGDSVVPTDRTCLRVINGDASAHTVSISVPDRNDRFGQTLPDISVAVPAGEERDIGPLTIALADPVTRRVEVSYSAATGMSVVAFRLP